MSFLQRIDIWFGVRVFERVARLLLLFSQVSGAFRSELGTSGRVSVLVTMGVDRSIKHNRGTTSITNEANSNGDCELILVPMRQRQSYRVPIPETEPSVPVLLSA